MSYYARTVIVIGIRTCRESLYPMGELARTKAVADARIAEKLSGFTSANGRSNISTNKRPSAGRPLCSLPFILKGGVSMDKPLSITEYTQPNNRRLFDRVKEINKNLEKISLGARGRIPFESWVEAHIKNIKL